MIGNRRCQNWFVIDRLYLDGKPRRDRKRCCRVIGCGHGNRNSATIAGFWAAAEGLGAGIKSQPTAGVSAWAGYAGRVGENRTRILILKGIGRQFPFKGTVLKNGLIAGFKRYRWGIIDIVDGQVKSSRGGRIGLIGGGNFNAERTHLGIVGRATEGMGRCVKIEPGGQGTPLQGLRLITQNIARIDIEIREGVAGKLKRKGLILGRNLVR